MTLFRAKWIVPVCSPPIENGAIAVEHGQIAAVGPWSSLRTEFGTHEEIDLGENAILPGFVNAHCHLDYTCMRGAILRPTSFAGWIARINELKRTLTDDDYLASIQEGIQESLAYGTTTLANIESFPEIMLRVPHTPLRIWWFLELIDARSRLPTENLVAGALAFFDEYRSSPGGTGLSPHAPYSTSAELYRAASECCITHKMPFTTHLAETDQELDMFLHGHGPLFDLLKRLGRDVTPHTGRTPFAHFLENCSPPPNAILAHMNFLSSTDWDLLARHGRNFSIVHCPRSHTYFDRPPFALKQFTLLGINLCLGTDSLASNSSLSMLSEIRSLLDAHPSLRPADALHMATLAGARALGQHSRLGAIAPGFSADLIAIPAPSADPYSDILSHTHPVTWSSLRAAI